MPRVRARLEARAEPPLDRWYDPIVDDAVRGGPLTRERFACHWRETRALAELSRAKLRPLDAALADALAEQHARLGAPRESLDAIERLRRGEAVAAVAGQQPAPLGGPLYSLHKTASAVGLAAVVTERTGVPCVPLFWMHGEDSDFAEIRSVAVSDPALVVTEATIPPGAHREGGLVGDIPVEPVREAHRAARTAWSPAPYAAEALGLLDRVEARARDLGELMTAIMLELFGRHGLVVVDPRAPAFRAQARVVIDRYLDRASELEASARRAGEWLEHHAGRRPLADPALESFVFVVEDGARRKVAAHEAKGAKVLSPNVALRPAVQDGVFPTVAMACGAAELGYLAQLREVFEGLGVRAACPVPRLSATWLPAAGRELLDTSGAPPEELLTNADRVVRELAERSIPPDVRDALNAERERAAAGLGRFAEIAREVDASLPQLVDSARGKIDYQYGRLAEGVAGKQRHRLERQHPEWARLRYVLLPGDKLQERRLASLEPVAFGGHAVTGEIVELAEEHGRGLVEGRHEHFVLER